MNVSEIFFRMKARMTSALTVTAVIATGCLLSSPAYAVPFEQPYPIGDTIMGNSNFSGTAYLAPISEIKELNVPMFNVTFEPGCRNSWHRHSGGQILISTAGTGYYQEKGKPARRLSTGDIVEIAPGVEHWHGAAPDSWFAHIAIGCNPGNNRVTWLSPLTDSEYILATTESARPTSDTVTSLSPRQQAIVAVGACAGRGDLAQLEKALTNALNASMTVNEIKEILVQTYAYAGFPRSLRALQTFMSVLAKRREAGIEDNVGREASPVKDMTGHQKYDLGRRNLAELSGIPADSPAAGYAVFAPMIEKFLKEHLFADIFNRDLLSWQDRELATVSIIAGVGDAEPMAAGHMAICLHQGLTHAQLTSLLDTVESFLGSRYSDPLRPIARRLKES